MMNGAPEEQAESGAEQQEDELLGELEQHLQGAEQVLQKLRAVQGKERGDASGGAKIDDDSTGSPSAQGMP